MKHSLLVTGGAGFIGSHVVTALLDAGHSVVVLDDLSTGKKELIDPRATFIEGSICNPTDLDRAFTAVRIDTVFHFAAKLLVEESVQDPLLYYRTNVGGSIELLRAMQRYHVDQMVFSSSAAVYGNPSEVPVTEHADTHPVNPYGQSKLMFERVLQDSVKTSPIRFVALRYFNVIDDGPTHLIASIVLTAAGKRPELRLFGTDYNTPDGTAIRDYIDIHDLVDAHVRAFEYLSRGGASEVCNVGTGTGYSVKRIIDVTKKITGIDFTVVPSPRRAGDPEKIVASYDHIHELLGWEPKHSIEESIGELWQKICSQR